MKVLRAKVTREPTVHHDPWWHDDPWWHVRITFLGLTIRRTAFHTHQQALDYAVWAVGL